MALPTSGNAPAPVDRPAAHTQTSEESAIVTCQDDNEIDRLGTRRFRLTHTEAPTPTTISREDVPPMMSQPSQRRAPHGKGQPVGSGLDHTERPTILRAPKASGR